MVWIDFEVYVWYMAEAMESIGSQRNEGDCSWVND
jgi:hypothetical protein